jgi:FKBP-type peptidyl-prolyl cis-trans isomerase
MNKRILQCMVIAPLTLMVGCDCKKVVLQQPQEQQKKSQEPKTMNTPTRTTTDSGLQYEVLDHSAVKADAKKPQRGNTVTVHYTGWLADENGNPRMDKQFDSSVARKQPFQFVIGIGQVIKGWDEGVMDMQVGEKRRLVIPASLGYGSRGAGSSIPANATLVFDVELIAVK